MKVIPLQVVIYFGLLAKPWRYTRETGVKIYQGNRHWYYWPKRLHFLPLAVLHNQKKTCLSLLEWLRNHCCNEAMMKQFPLNSILFLSEHDAFTKQIYFCKPCLVYLGLMLLVPCYYLLVCVATKWSCLLMECQVLHLKGALLSFVLRKIVLYWWNTILSTWKKST